MAVAKAHKKRKSHARRSTKSVAHHKHHHMKAAANRRRNATRVVVIHPRTPNRKRRHSSRNPTFMGQHLSVTKMAELVAAGLVGVAVNKAILPMLPASITSNNISVSIAAFVIAGLEWWGGSMIDKDFGAAAGFGGLMNAMSQALNAFIPSVGAYVSLSGRRGTGDFVRARYAVPQNPITDASSGLQLSGGLGTRAYPPAYGVA